MPNSSLRVMNARPARVHLNLTLFLALLAASFVLPSAGIPAANAQTTYSGGGSITATGVNSSGSSTLVVSGAPGSVNTIYVTLDGVTSDGLACCDSVYFTSFVLESPGGTKMVLLGGTGDSIDGDDNQDSGSGLKNSTITIEDGKSAAPDGASWAPQGTNFTVAPSSYWLLPNLNGPQYASLPSDINGDKLPQTDGTSPDGPDSGNATLDGTFANSAANGTWTLYILTNDQFGLNDVVSVSGWSLTMTFNAAASPTSTSISTNTANPASTTNSITYTATVSSTSTVNTGTVDFTANGATISGCGSQAVSGGTATCSTTLSNQGLYAIEAAYNAGSGFESSTSSPLEQLVEHPSTEPTTDKWCNTSSIAVPGQSFSLAYPSVIKVSGYPAGTTVGNVEVEFENVTGIINAQSLLVAPGGTSNLDFFDYGFNQADSTSNGIDLNFYDSAEAYPDPDNGPTGGATYNYEASDTLPAGNTDTFSSSSAPIYDISIPQVPSTVHYGYDPYSTNARGPVTETFGSNFNGASANGTWALYEYEGDAVNETIGGGWCIALTINPGTPTTTTLTTNANPQTPQQPVTLTAAVKSGSSPVTSGGTVTFLENGTAPPGTSGGDNVVNLNTTTGQASFTTGTLSTTITIDAENSTNSTKTVYEGDYPFSAEYSGDTNDNPSIGNLVERFDNATTFSAGAGGSFNACNADPVLLSNGVEGAFAPNPSNIFVSNIPGTLSTVTLTLNGYFSANEDAVFDTEALIKGPTGAALDFFSNTGDASTVLGGTTGPWGNLTFEDSASSIVPSSGNYAAGSYKPTAYQGSSSTDAFTSSSSGFYNVPGSFDYAQPHGSGTFASTFGSTSPNGTWSLFFNATDFLAAEGAQSGWCLNFTENPVSVTPTLGHSGTGTSGDFVQGETNAQITVNIENDGAGSAGDPLGGNANPLKVVDTLPSGLTYASSSGSGWSSCSTVGQSVTCVNDTASVAQDSSYPQLTINVNVSGTVTGSLTNSITVSGAGVTSTSANDSIRVDVPSATAANNAVVPFSPSSQSVTLSATVTSNGVGVSGGAVTFEILEGSTLIGVPTTSGTVNNGGASVNYTLPAGTTGGVYTIEATYNDLGGSYETSSENTATLTVNAITPVFSWSPPSTIIVGTAGTGVLNAMISCGASCGAISYTATPTVGGVPSGPAVSITTTSGLTAGTYNIAADFTPNSGDYNLTSDTQPITVSGESVWVVNSGGSTAELAGNGAAITSSTDPGANAAVAIDSTGNVWTVGTGSTLLEGTSQTGIVQQSISSGGGLNAPSAIAIDGNSQLWIANSGNNSVSLFLNNGTAVSPSTGFTDSSLSNPSGIAVDLGGSVWIANQGNNSVTRILGAAAPAAPLSTAAASNTTGAKP